MNELSERARKLTEQTCGGACERCEKVIEQALLAERRLAVTDMANLLSVEAKKWDKRTANRNSYEYASELLRAAAEKEVGK